MKKLGAFSGVFVPTVLSVIGAVLFLLGPYFVQDQGLGISLLIVALCAVIMAPLLLTLAKTGKNYIGNGGFFAYLRLYGDIHQARTTGFFLFLAQAFTVGFFAISISTPLGEILKKSFIIEFMDNNFYHWSPLFLKQLVGTLVIGIIFIISLAPHRAAVIIQNILFALLAVFVIFFLVSPLLFPGFFGGSTAVFSAEGATLSFSSALLLLFPAFTGFNSGVGYSGLLKKDKKVLSRGLIGAGIFILAVYVLFFIYYAFVRNTPDAQTGGGGSAFLSIIDLYKGSITYFLIMGIGLFSAATCLITFKASNLLLKAVGRKALPAVKNNNLLRSAIIAVIALLVVWAGDIDLLSTITGVMILYAGIRVLFTAALGKMSILAAVGTVFLFVMSCLINPVVIILLLVLDFFISDYKRGYGRR